MIANLLKNYCTCDIEGKLLMKEATDKLAVLAKERASVKKVLEDMLDATKNKEVCVMSENNQQYVLRLKKKKMSPAVTSAVVKRIEQLVAEPDFKTKVFDSQCTDPLDSLCEVIVNETCPQSLSGDALDILVSKRPANDIEVAPPDLADVFGKLLEKTELISKHTRDVKETKDRVGEKKKDLEAKLITELEKRPEPMQKVTMTAAGGEAEHFYLRVKQKKVPAKKKLSRGAYAKLTKGVLDDAKAEFRRLSREMTIDDFTKAETLERFLTTIGERIRAKEAAPASSDEKRMSLDRVRAHAAK